jgi:hypothetical protein
LESLKISHDTLDIPTIFAVIQSEIRSSLASEHLWFISRTLEKADFVLNPVRIRILTVRYSYLFSLHVLDALMGVKTVRDFVQCITLALREFICFDSSHLCFFSHFLCDLIARGVLIKKDKTEMKNAMDREELNRLYQKLKSEHEALLVKVARIEAELARESDPFEGTEKKITSKKKFVH